MAEPMISEIRKGRDIGKRQTRQSFIWQSCIECGVPRWVRIRKGNPTNLRCNRCANKYKIKIKPRIININTPFIGEIRQGRNIGNGAFPSHSFIWQSCLNCGKSQWVKIVKGKPRNLRCRRCANKDRVKPQIINSNLPFIGEIRKGRNIGKIPDRDYIWQSCLDCGRTRWVRLAKMVTENFRCLKCSANKIEANRSQADKDKRAKVMKEIWIRLGYRISHSGENNPSWSGGKSFEPYTKEFNKQLKYLIRVRDNFTCQLCGVPEREYCRALTPHHINYDKKNSLPANLITLCTACNSKVNFNREYWTMYFRELLNKRQLYPNQLGHELKKSLDIPTLDEYRVRLSTS